MAVNDLITRTDAGPLIPEDESNVILQAVQEQSAARRLMRTVTMSTKQTRLPVLSTLPQAYFVDGDAGLKQTTALQWANRYLIAEEIAVIVPVPDNVIADSQFDLWAEIRPNLVAAVGRTLDAAVLFGVNKPASWPAAVVPGAVAAGNTFTRGSVVDQDVAEDVNQVMALVEDDGFTVNGFAARPRMRSTLRGLRATDGTPIYSPSLTGATPATLYGEQVAYVDGGAWDETQADLIAGDWTQAVLGIRQDISFRVFTEGVVSDNTGTVVLNLMQQDTSALRLTFRVAFQVANPITSVNLVEANRYPFAVLEPVAGP